MHAGALIDLWAEGRQAMSELGRLLDGEDADRPVPACPAWTVRDVYAHQAGVVADVLGGNMDGAPGDDWTGRQVSTRAGASLTEILDEWDAGAPKLVEALRPLGDAVDPRLLADLWTHTQDVRGAVGRPGDRDTDLARWVMRGAVLSYVVQAREAGLPRLHVAHDAGDGQAPRLVVDPFEFARARVGRRSPAQVRTWTWEVDDPEPHAALVPLFGPRDTDLLEPA